MNDLLYETETSNIIGAAIEVHKVLGCGFSEKIYQEALAIEFGNCGIPFEKEKHLNVEYKGQQLKHDYFADFICYGKIIVELKAVSSLLPEHQAQVINYLRCADVKVGLLLNFGESSLKIKRIVY